MNRSWFIFYGHKLGMSRAETLTTPYGEMMDMMSCMAIFNGSLKQKVKPRAWAFDDAMALR